MGVSEEKLIDLVRTGDLSRRQALGLLGSLGVVLSATSLGSTKAFAADEPTFFTWATMDVPEFFPTYIAKHGAPPKFAIFGDQEEALLKVRNGFKPDVVYPQSYSCKRWFEAGLLEPIDISKISHWSDIFEPLREIDGVKADGNVVWVPVDWGMSSVLVRTDLAPEYEGKDSWDILWDEKYKGRLSVLDSMADAVGAAALKAGVNAYEMDDAEIAKVRETLTVQRPLLRVYSNDPTSTQQSMTSGEIVAANTWNDCYVALKGANVPVHYMRPKQGVMAWVGGLSIVKGTPYRDLAHEIINAYLEPRARAYSMTQFGYASSTAAGFKAVDSATLAKLGLPEDPSEFLKTSVIQRPMKNYAKVQKMFEDVKQGL
ncbi:MAG: extracellular solute-binding protein [Hyphomicrobium sp.]|uniref:ABC transporter substrate-binding protein n=1 Tax=Hyphomicrobium sp. TaxID=82 RepID=UPI0039E3D340